MTINRGPGDEFLERVGAMDPYWKEAALAAWVEFPEQDRPLDTQPMTVRMNGKHQVLPWRIALEIAW